MAQDAAGLISMKRPRAGQPGSDEAMPSASEIKRPEYGYGLVLRLENPELDKLKLGLPDVGQKMTLQAEGYVESVHESQSMGNQGDRSVSIQITDLAVKASAE